MIAFDQDDIKGHGREILQSRSEIVVREKLKNHISILLSTLLNSTSYSTPFFFSLVVMLNEWMDEHMNSDFITNCRVKHVFFYI